MSQYKPTNVYSTGHSLGGYLAQYFASHTMQQTAKRSEAFKHSALFNPAKLTVDKSSPSSLDQALRYTENTMVKKDWLDDSDKIDIKNLEQTNSYVITGEWVAYGFNETANDVIDTFGTVGGAAAGAAAGATVGSLLGPVGTLVGGVLGAIFGGAGGKKVADKISFEGLGTYTNTTEFDFRKNVSWGKHDLKSFFMNDSKLYEHFSKSYRIDPHYHDMDSDKDGLTDIVEKHIGTNHKQANKINGTDSDKDGFSDRLELSMGHDFLNAKDKIDLKHYYDIKSDEAEFLSVVTTETQSGKLVNTVGVEMFAQVIDNKLVYTKIANSTDTPIAWADEDWQAWQDSGSLIVQGTTQNNHLKGSLKNEILWGGKGDDTLDGYEGNDVLIGGAGDDWLRGGGGKDILIGGSGNNILDGGEGADRFVLSKQGFSTIVSFAAQEDKLDVSEFQAAFQESDGAKPTLSQILHESTQTGKAALIFDANSDTLSYQDKNGQLTALARFDADVTAEMLRNSLIV